MTEPDFENLLLNDNTAHIIQESHINKIRKLNKNVCDNLKKYMLIDVRYVANL